MCSFKRIMCVAIVFVLLMGSKNAYAAKTFRFAGQNPVDS